MLKFLFEAMQGGKSQLEKTAEPVCASGDDLYGKGNSREKMSSDHRATLVNPALP